MTRTGKPDCFATATASASSRRGKLGESAMTASDFGAEHFVRHARQKRGIHAAGIRHEAGTVLAQPGTQRFQLVHDHGLTLAFLQTLVEPAACESA